MSDETLEGPQVSALNHAIWPAGTVITMCNVPWDQQYRNGVPFSSRDALNSYIDGRGESGRVYDNVTYVRASDPIMLEDPFNTIWKYNYLRVSNPAQPTTVGAPDEQRDYYYFITDVQHVAPNTTMVTVSLDLFQTFFYETEFGSCFIETGHVGIAQANTMDDRGRRYLTAPEGLDTGSAYVVKREHTETLLRSSSAYVIYATCDLNGKYWNDDAETIPNTPPVKLPYMPFGAASGIGVWVVRAGNIYSALDQLPAHIQQTIINIVAVPHLEDYFPGYDYPVEGSNTALAEPPFGSRNVPTEKFGARQFSTFPTQWRNGLEAHIPQRFRHLHKFKTFPYCLIEMSHGADNTLTLRPELFSTFGMYVRSELSAHLAEPSMRAIPMNYNGEAIDWQNFVTSGTLPRLGTANDNAAIAMAASANVRAYQTEQADWGQRKSLRGNQVSYDAATRGIEAAQQSQNIAADFATSQQAQGADWAMQDAWRGAATGTAQGLAAGAGGGALLGPVGAVAGGVIGGVGGAVQGGLRIWETDIQNGRNAMLTAQSNANAQGQLNVAQGVARGNRDANRALADWAARGDYQQAIAGQNAAIQDTLNTPPSVAAMPQGSVDAVVRDRFAITLKVKMIDSGTMNRVGEFWLRYGYNIGEYMTPPANGMVMQKFTYWKMTECNLKTAPMPESFRDALRGMFEKGITLWVDPDDIGTSPENEPIYGEYY